MKFRFFLTQNLTVSVIDEPVGWDDVRLSIKRDLASYGAVFEFSTELSFYGDARSIIENVYFSQNIDGIIVLSVEYWDVQEFEWKPFYEGVLVLKDLQLSRVYAKCRIEQTDFNRVFRNKRDLDVALVANKKVTLHSKTIKQKSEWEHDAEFETVLRENYPVFASNLLAFQFPSKNVINELQTTQVPLASYTSANIAGTEIESQGAQEIPAYYAEFDFDGVVTLTYDIDAEFHSSSYLPYQQRFVLMYYVGNNYVVPADGVVTILYQNPAGGGIQSMPSNTNNIRPFAVAGAQTFNVSKGQKIWFYVRVGTFVPFGDVQGVSGLLYVKPTTSFSISQDTKYKQSECEGVDIFDAFNQIVENYTGLPNRFRSDFFTTGCGKNMFLTNGYKLRLKNEKDVFCSFDRLYNDLRAIFNLGVAVTNEAGVDVVRVENMAYFFNNTTVLEIENPNDKMIAPHMDLYFNKIVVGYKKWANEQLNGLDEYNSERQYSLLIKLGQYQNEQKSRIELNLMCESIAAGYLIEQARRLAVYTTTDNKEFDSDLFLVCLNRKVVTYPTEDGVSFVTYPIGSTSERDEMWVDVDNVIDRASVYNLRITPVQNLSKWIPYIHSQICKNFENLKIIQFRSGTGNIDLQTSALSTILPCTPLYYENKELDASLPVLTNNQALFDAEVVELEYPLTFSEFLSLKSAVYSVVKVDSIDYYILNIEYSPNKISVLKLIKRYV